jgi:serine protease
MAMRYMVAALATMAALAVSTVAGSAGTPTPKRALLQGTSAAVRTTDEPRVGRLIVKFRDGALATGAIPGGRASRREVEQATGIGMTPVRELSGGAVLMALPAAMPLTEARSLAQRLEAHASVEYADPDVRFRRLATPNDPRYGTNQWNLFPPTAEFTAGSTSGGGSKTALATGGANLPGAWDLTAGGSAAVVVAVIDTGIVNHPDLNGVSTPSPYVPAGRFLPGYDFVSSDVGAEDGLPANFVSGDNDGPDADPTDPGDWLSSTDASRFPSCSGDAGDSSWHGTHMAGIVAATTNNGLGVAGIGWNVRVLPVRAIGKCGGSLSDIEEAIRWAAGLPVNGAPQNATPARVISLSLGGGGSCSNSMQAAVDAAIAAGAVIVAATGNESDTALISPASCRGVIAVTGHTINGENADYANIGAETAISAPGGGTPISLGANGPTDDPSWIGYYVWSTSLFGTTDPFSADAQGRTGAAYGGFTGTSVAAPQVAGVAALLKSALPSASAAEVRAFLVNNARPHPVGSPCATNGAFDRLCGAGLLDAHAALSRAVGNVGPVTPPGGGDGGGGALPLGQLLLLGALLLGAHLRRRD